MNLRITLFCLLGGLCFTISALGAGHFGWWYLSGIVMVAAFAPVVRFGPRSVIARWATIFLVLLIVGLVCTMSERVVFFPVTNAEMMKEAVGGTVLYLLASAVMLLIAKLLKLNDESGQAVAHRSPAVAVPMVILAAVSYLVYYEIFGAIIFIYFTKGYYPHAVEQVMAMGSWFFVYQIARGLLMTLAALPVIYTLRLTRWQAAVTVGLLIWVVGGLSPLLVPNAAMGTAQRYIHIVEIFTQNFALGVTATLLLRPRKNAVALHVQPVAAA
jgi:hypothetical protein